MSGSQADRILVAEDDADLRGLIEFALRNAGLRVYATPDGASALEAFSSERFALLILHLTVPGADVFAVCEAVRRKSTVPIIIVSDVASEADVIRAFAIGADDYFVKPFSPRMFLARVQAILRRTEYESEPGTKLEANGVELNVRSQKLRFAGKDVRLSRIETVLLHTLMRSAGQIVSGQALAEAAWDRREWTAEKNALKQIVFRLRRKLERQTTIAGHLRTTRNEGYCWSVAEQ